MVDEKNTVFFFDDVHEYDRQLDDPLKKGYPYPTVQGQHVVVGSSRCWHLLPTPVQSAGTKRMTRGFSALSGHVTPADQTDLMAGTLKRNERDR